MPSPCIKGQMTLGNFHNGNGAVLVLQAVSINTGQGDGVAFKGSFGIALECFAFQVDHSVVALLLEEDFQRRRAALAGSGDVDRRLQVNFGVAAADVQNVIALSTEAADGGIFASEDEYIVVGRTSVVIVDHIIEIFDSRYGCFDGVVVAFEILRSRLGCKVIIDGFVKCSLLVLSGVQLLGERGIITESSCQIAIVSICSVDVLVTSKNVVA